MTTEPTIEDYKDPIETGAELPVIRTLESLSRLPLETGTYLVGEPAALFAALSAAQGAFPPIPKTRTVKVKTRGGETYSFDYAPLDAIIDATRPALASNGLAVWATQNEGLLTTVLAHASGAAIVSVTPMLGDQSEPQKLGSVITYARRYQLGCLLGVAPETDDDGNAAQGNQSTVAQRPSRNPPSPAQERPQTAAAAPIMPENRITSATKLALKDLLETLHIRGNANLRDSFYAATGSENFRDLTETQGTAWLQHLTVQAKEAGVL
jgi:hypothetical protein